MQKASTVDTVHVSVFTRKKKLILWELMQVKNNYISVAKNISYFSKAFELKETMK